MSEFKVGDRVRVIGGKWFLGGTGVITAIANLQYGIMVSLDTPPGGSMDYAPAELEPAPAPDAEIARLREQVDTLTRERDTAREALAEAEHTKNLLCAAFDDVYKAVDQLAVLFVDAGIVPPSALAEFRSEIAVYEPLLKMAKEALATVDAANALADGGE